MEIGMAFLQLVMDQSKKVMEYGKGKTNSTGWRFAAD
jgi:hypothetical protein